MKKNNLNNKWNMNKSFSSNMYANKACCLIVENARMEGKDAKAFEKGVIKMAKEFQSTMSNLPTKDGEAFELAAEGMTKFWDSFVEEYRLKEGQSDFNDKFYFLFGFALMTSWYENIKDNKKKVA